MKRNDLIYLIKGNQIDNKNNMNYYHYQYNIDIQPDEYFYLRDTDENNFLKTLTNISDIKWNDTVMLFHYMNSLFILYYRKKEKIIKQEKIYY